MPLTTQREITQELDSQQHTIDGIKTLPPPLPTSPPLRWLATSPLAAYPPLRWLPG
ncbi:MAG: hypothetical protein MJE68_27100 [Proteobacteria bacterium]|nr:hypothetical protein [Pseudomonadota bacterium]